MGKPVWDEDTGMVVVDMKSTSRPDVVHKLYCRMMCSCEGYTHRKTCKHVKKALRAITKAMRDAA